MIFNTSVGELRAILSMSLSPDADGNTPAIMVLSPREVDLGRDPVDDLP
jgi:hypothetical protein